MSINSVLSGFATRPFEAIKASIFLASSSNFSITSSVVLPEQLELVSSTFHLPSREIQTNISRILTAQYAMHVSFMSTANFLVTIFVKSEWELLDKYE